MRIRVFRALRTADAMTQVRTTLGEEAVILGTRRVGGEVEVTAALEAPEPVLILPDPPAAPPPERVPGWEACLAWHNLPDALGGRWASRGGETPAERLAGALRFAPLPDGGARPLLLAGPPGAGKTLTCAKLATRAVLAGRRPLVVSADAARAGAAEQLAAFTRLLGVPLALAAEPGTLAKALSAHRQPGEAVLIDTAGCNPFNPDEAEALLALARAASAALVLVLPAGLDAMEAAEIAAAFARLGATHLLPTRLDQARRLGAVLAAAGAGLSLTEAGTGPGVTDGLTAITPDWLANRLLAGHNAAWPSAEREPPPTAQAGAGPPPWHDAGEDTVPWSHAARPDLAPGSAAGSADAGAMVPPSAPPRTVQWPPAGSLRAAPLAARSVSASATAAAEALALRLGAVGGQNAEASRAGRAPTGSGLNRGGAAAAGSLPDRGQGAPKAGGPPGGDIAARSAAGTMRGGRGEGWT